jgi:hypothetical protein
MALSEQQTENIGTGLAILQAAYGAATGAGDDVVIVEEEPTFFDQYGPWLLGGSAALILILALRR